MSNLPCVSVLVVFSGQRVEEQTIILMTGIDVPMVYANAENIDNDVITIFATSLYTDPFRRALCNKIQIVYPNIANYFPRIN